MASLSGQQGGGSKENPPGQSSSGPAASTFKHDNDVDGKGSDKGGGRDQTSSETTRTSDALGGIDSGGEGHKGSEMQFPAGTERS